MQEQNFVRYNNLILSTASDMVEDGIKKDSIDLSDFEDYMTDMNFFLDEMREAWLEKEYGVEPDVFPNEL